jgi:hypothetical protein
MVPLVAMQFDAGVDWTLSDFVFAGFLLFSTGFAYELVGSRVRSGTYRAAAGLALLSALLLVWVNGAVGIIGSENNPANAMFLGVLAIGFLGAIAARLRPRGMATTLFAMAGVTALIGLVALSLGLGAAESRPVEILGAAGMFVTLFAGSGLLFRNAAMDEAGGRVGQPA